MIRVTGLTFLCAISLLSACGGGGSDNNGSTEPPPTPGIGRLQVTNPAGTAAVVRNISYSTAPGTAAQRQAGTTDLKGEFKYDTAEQVTFKLFNQSITTPAKAVINENDLATSLCKGSATVINCQYATAKNLQRLLLSTDTDEDYTNGISILAPFQQDPPSALDSSIEQFDAALALKLAKFNRQSVALFRPSLGINLEAPQPEADEVGGQPVAFVDLFRGARPFTEYSCTDITYDAQGWPATIPASCDTQDNAVFRTPTWATSLILRYVPLGAIPVGKYTVLYEGSGDIQYSGIGSKLPAESSFGRDVIEITPELIKTRNVAGLRIQLKNIDPNNPLKNIRVIMPGGICAGNPLVRVDSETDCPSGAYQSFVDTLQADRNNIVFNPDYLRFLKDFKVIRTMNFMEASPRNPCYTLTDAAYTTCLLQDFNWNQRAKMDDASWGGSARTPLLQRYGRGVPLEVIVKLVNQLERDPWFNIPHNATDDYVTQFATYVRDHLKPGLKAHIEYTNEPWNGIFWASLYVREKGKDLDSNAYRAGYKYYSKRAVEIFTIWRDVFGGTDRLVRILNTYHPDEFMSRNMLSENGNSQSVDAIASAPYFQGCWDRSSNAACADETRIPKVMQEITSVDDIFDIIDNKNDPYGLTALNNWTKIQAQVAKDFNVKLFTYEGGQHLTVRWEDATLSTERKNSLLDLFRAANRDIRMAGRYSQMLNGWKDNGGELFMLYTLPQTYHRFGSFGIKEHLNQSRFDAPKYDMSMQFQETQGKCWWDSCE